MSKGVLEAIGNSKINKIIKNNIANSLGYIKDIETDNLYYCESDFKSCIYIDDDLVVTNVIRTEHNGIKLIMVENEKFDK